jgi:hypothetical protein
MVRVRFEWALLVWKVTRQGRGVIPECGLGYLFYPFKHLVFRVFVLCTKCRDHFKRACAAIVSVLWCKMPLQEKCRSRSASETFILN